MPPRHGTFDQQWDDFDVAFFQRKPLDPLPVPDPTPDPIDWAVGVLNSALVCDPGAMRDMMALEVAVNDALSEHPTIQVGASLYRHGGEYTLRPLGLINGLFGVDSDDCWIYRYGGRTQTVRLTALNGWCRNGDSQ